MGESLRAMVGTIGEDGGEDGKDIDGDDGADDKGGGGKSTHD